MLYLETDMDWPVEKERIQDDMQEDHNQLDVLLCVQQH